MNYILSIALLLSLACYNRSARVNESGGGDGVRATHAIKIHGESRGYSIYKPPLPDGEKVALMIVLHGGLGNAESVEASTEMNRIADSGGFIVAYPNGTGGRFGRMKDRRTWNAGVCCGQAVKRGVDDVGFIAAMIDEIGATQPVDLRRVYVAGMSNGAMMTYRLACEIPEKLAAIIPVSGTLAVSDCSAARDIPVMHIHGDSDPNVPLEGGHGGRDPSGVSHRSVPETMRMITASRGCSGSETEALNDSVERTIYNCSGGAPVELLIVKGGGHSWPGGRQRAGHAGGSTDFSASQMAWDFARQFTKKR